MIAARIDVERVFGPTNVRNWADLESRRDEGHIASRIEWSLELAEAKVTARLRRGPYAVPFADPVDPVVVDLIARMAGVLLYDSRGAADGDGETNTIAPHRRQADETIRAIMAGQVRLSHARTKSHPATEAMR
jgi:hypothetical protein